MEGAKILELCEKGDKMLDAEVGKVYKGKKVPKGEWTFPSACACFVSFLHSTVTVFGELFAYPMTRHFPPYHGLPQLLCHALYSPSL